MYCSREYQASTRLNQQYEKSTSNPWWWIVDEMSQPSNPIPTGGGRLRPVGGPAWEHGLCKRGMMIFQLNTMHYGKWQLSACQWHNKMPQGGGMPHLHSVGFVPRTSCLPLQPQTPRISGSSGRKRCWLWPRCYRLVQRHQGPRQAFSVRWPGSFSSHGPFDDPQWGQCC